MRLPSGDGATDTVRSFKKGRGGPPVNGMTRVRPEGAESNMISDPSAEKVTLLTGPLPLRASLPFVRLMNRPVPTCVRKTSGGPSRSETNATNLPSGEIAASYSALSKSVKRTNVAPLRGFCGIAAVRLLSHRMKPAASPAAATQGSHFTPRPAGAAGAASSVLWRPARRRSTTKSRRLWYRSAGSFSSAFSTAIRNPGGRVCGRRSGSA